MTDALILDRSTARTLAAFAGGTLELEGRDPAWCGRLRGLLAGRRPGLLAVGLGPGSFAGVRSAIACLQGMGLAWGLRPKGFPSAALCALASGLPEVTVVGDARRGTLWAVRFAVGPDTIAQRGPFRILARGRFEPSGDMVSPDAARLAEFGLRPVALSAALLPEAVRRLGGALTEDPAPYYLHPAVGAAPAE